MEQELSDKFCYLGYTKHLTYCMLDWRQILTRYIVSNCSLKEENLFTIFSISPHLRIIHDYYNGMVTQAFPPKIEQCSPGR